MQSKDGKADHRGPAPVSGVVPQGQNPAGIPTENSMMVSVTGILASVQQKIDVETIDADPHSRATLPTIPLPSTPERSPAAEWDLLKQTLAEVGLDYEDGFPTVDHVIQEKLDYLFRGLAFGIASHRFSGEASHAARRYMVMIEQAKRVSMTPPSNPTTALRSAGAPTKESPMGTDNPAAGPVPAPAADDQGTSARDTEREDGFLAPDEFEGPDSSILPPATEQDSGPSFSDHAERRDAGKTADAATLPKAVVVKRAVGGLMVPPPRTDASVAQDAATIAKSPAAATPPPPPSRRPDPELDAPTLLRASSPPPPASPHETIDAPTLIRPSQSPPPGTPAAPGVAKPALASKAPPPPSSRLGAAPAPVRRRPATKSGNTPKERTAMWHDAAQEDEGIRSDLPPSPDGSHPSVPPPPPAAPPAPASGLDGAHQQVLESHMDALDDLMTAAAVSMDHGKLPNADGSVQLAGKKIQDIDAFVNATSVPERIRLSFTKKLNKARDRLTALRKRLEDARSAAKKPEEPMPPPVPQTPPGQGSGHMTQSNMGAGPPSKGPPQSSTPLQNGKPKSGKARYWKVLGLVILAGATYLMMFQSGPSSDQTAHVWSSESCQPVTAELVKKYFHQSDPAHLAHVEDAKPGDPRIDMGTKAPEPVGKIIANVYDVSGLKICGTNKSPSACVDATAENLKKFIGQSDPTHVVQVEVPLPDDPYIEANGKQLTPVEQRTLNVYDVSHAKVCTSK